MIDACTIIAGNYLAAARVLAKSFFTHHPDGTFTVLVVDDEQRDIAPVDDHDRRVEWWRLADLGLETAEIHRLAGIYDVSELSTAVKPLFLQCLLRRRELPVIYLDPDICVFGSLAWAPVLAERHGVVLTPHMTHPMPDDGRQVDALFVLAAGVYNLGFAVVAPSAAPCLDWWWQQTRRRALIDVEHQMFTDQRWADYMPSLFSPYLLKDPGYNAAYWNLHERPLTRAHGRVYARNVALRFFHFSGFNPGTPWLLSRHQGDRPRILLSEHPVLAALCDDYAEALDRAGFAESSQRTYGWAVSADGLTMTARIRRLYWSALLAAERGQRPEPPDPFDAAHREAFTAWLNTPDEYGPRLWSRYLLAIYQARPDVEAHMPDIDGADAATFANWVRTGGVVEERIPPSLMSGPLPVAGQSLAPPDHAEPSAPHGLNVCGFFQAELGVGEAARLLLRAIDASGSAYATTTQHGIVSREQHGFDDRDPAGGLPFDINLICVNADLTPRFALDTGPAFFVGRHTIGYWFWEVDPLPAEMHRGFNHVDEVWTATEYVAGIMRTAAAGRTPVYTVPVPLMPPATCALTREQLGLPADRFVFLFVFDFLSIMERKNPLGTIEAFNAAFAPGEGPVLVLKSINGDKHLTQLEQLRHAAAHRSDIVIRDGYLGADEKNALLAACDCYVSLHRAEGLGLTLAEAMALGKPAIATGYSGNRHFMTNENSFLVDYQLTNASGDFGPYPPGARWAEPDLRHAAQLMRTLYQHPGEAARRAERGRADLLFHHGVMSSAAAISNRLEAIRQARAAAAVEASASEMSEGMAEATAAEASGEIAEVLAGAAAVERLEEMAAATAIPMAESQPPAAGTLPEPLEEPAPAADVAMRAAAFEALAAFTAVRPQLRQLGELHLSHDDRPWHWLRRGVQRALFRIIRPYSFQQQQFQTALLEAVQVSFDRLAGPAAVPPVASQSEEVVATVMPEPAGATEHITGRPLFGAWRDLRVSLVIGFCCMLVYNANGRAISAGDAFAARYQPFAIWAHGTVLLEPIETLVSGGRERPADLKHPHPGAAFWMVRTAKGRLVSIYPPVLPVLISPLYLPAVAYVYERGWLDDRIDRVARIMEKLTASLLAALSAALLYLVLRRRAKPSIAILLTVAYAFGTTTWVISSQALWQHGMSELLVVGLMLLLTAPSTVPRALAAGLLCGLIAGNRPADAVVAAALGVFALFWAGRRALLVGVAASLPALLVLLYNVAIVGAVAGAYRLVGGWGFFGYAMGPGLAGLLFSPTRGLFVFSPFLLFLVFAWRHLPRDRAEQGLTLAISGGIILHLALHSRIDWRGGVAWGPRFLTDILPLLIWLLVPVVVALGRRGRACFVAAVAIAITIEAVGAFAYTGVTDQPIYAVATGPDRLRAAWDWRNAPFIASLSRGLAPAEITLLMRGTVDTLELDGRPTDTVVAGQDVIATGWALAGRATPLQVGITVDGRELTAVRTFANRPDIREAVPGAGPAGWRIPIKTADLTPGEHRLSLYLWASEQGDPYFLARRTLTVKPAAAQAIAASSTDTAAPSRATPEGATPAGVATAGVATAGRAAVAAPAVQPRDPDLDTSFRTAAARIREHQQGPGYWLTAFTQATRFEKPGKEMNTYLTSVLVDLLDPLANAGLGDSVQRARRHLTAQIEAGGLVRYHGLPDGPGIGTLGCVITPDTDDTALVWRIAPGPDRQRLSTALATIDGYRTGDGLYRSWLAARNAYQCLDPGNDPNPADVAIQMHLLQLLLQEQLPAGRALCEALRRHLDDDRNWVYYRLSPLVPILRVRDLERAGCQLELPASRMLTTVPGQQIWVSVVELLSRASRPKVPRPDRVEVAKVLRQLANDDFALLRQSPPLLYHNDLTATVPRYYWSEDVGYALWLRLARDAAPIGHPGSPSTGGDH